MQSLVGQIKAKAEAGGNWAAEPTEDATEPETKTADQHGGSRARAACTDEAEQ